MNLQDLSFYCIDCGKISKSHELEKKKIPSAITHRVVFECPKCSETKFEVYSSRAY